MSEEQDFFKCKTLLFHIISECKAIVVWGELRLIVKSYFECTLRNMKKNSWKHKILTLNMRHFYSGVFISILH